MIDAALARIAQSCLEAPLTTTPWLHVSGAIARELDGFAVMINLAPGWSPLGTPFAVEIDTSALRSLAENHHWLNPWAGISRRYHEGYFGAGFDAFSPSQLRESEFFNDWMRPSGLGSRAVYGGFPVLREAVDELLIALLGHAGRSPLKAAHLEIGTRAMPYLKHLFLLLERLAPNLADPAAADKCDTTSWSAKILDRIRIAARAL